MMIANGFVEIDNEARGNCLFEAVSFFKYGTTEAHEIVRKETMDYFVKEREFFDPFIDGETFDDYVTRLRRDGEWGDNFEVQIMANLYGYLQYWYLLPSPQLRNEFHFTCQDLCDLGRFIIYSLVNNIHDKHVHCIVTTCRQYHFLNPNLNVWLTIAIEYTPATIL